MVKCIVLLVSIILISTFINAQEYRELQGIVFDYDSKPMQGATVQVDQLKKFTSTDVNGNFIIKNLKKGRYTIFISFIGYKTITDTIEIPQDTILFYRMEPATLSLQEVLVLDNSLEERRKTASLNVEIVNENHLRQNLGNSLMKTLDRLPGVSSMEIGVGQSKPVVRGLGFNRVVVFEHNIKHEAQQWGNDHGLEIDQYAADYIEIIKGPASLIYGSDAIGGVIDLKKRKIPQANTIGGAVDFTGKTNNNLFGTSINLYGRKKCLFADFRTTFLDFSDYKIPADSIEVYSFKVPLYNNYLRNTAGKEVDFHFIAGILKDKYQNKTYLINYNAKNGFFANAHGLEPRNVDNQFHDKSIRDIQFPYHLVNHFKIINSSLFFIKTLKVSLDLGYQHNSRQEISEYVQHGYMPAIFPDTLNFSSFIERQFKKSIYSMNLSFFNQFTDKHELTVGANFEVQYNKIGGRNFIIPNFILIQSGIFVVTKHKFSNVANLQAGIRYDYANLKTQEYFDWYPSPIIFQGDTIYKHFKRADKINRHFSNLSWSVGYNYKLQNLILKINLGKSFRIPLAHELASNGVNYHRFSYEIGKSDLSSEVSYQFDAGIEYGNNNLAISFTPFVNYFSNYIYLNPSYEYDRFYGNGYQIFYYSQAKVVLVGGEIHSHFDMFKILQIGLIGEYTYSEQLSGEKKGFPLPFSPPLSWIINIKLKKQKMSFIENPCVYFDYNIISSQNNIVPPEEKTPGAQFVNIGLNGKIFVNNHKINIFFQVRNLFNMKYFNHISYYRLINVSEPGRNYILNIQIPF